MEKELLNSDKELLLKDLCGRLPYGVKGILCEDVVWTLDRIWTKKGYELVVCAGDYYDVDCFKPYLFPLSSMTKEQENEWCDICLQPLIKRLDRHTREEDLILYAESQYAGSDWLNKNHFDYRGLIPMGLAKDATGLNIY